MTHLLRLMKTSMSGSLYKVTEVSGSLWILIWSSMACAQAQGLFAVAVTGKWIPWAIWIQLIQLNAVNNWSDSETDPSHMGVVTSSFEGWNPTPVQLDCPRSFVPQSVHCIWLQPVKDTKQSMRTEGEVTLALSRSARVRKDNRPNDNQSLEAHEIVTWCSLQTWTQS